MFFRLRYICKNCLLVQACLLSGVIYTANANALIIIIKAIVLIHQPLFSRSFLLNNHTMDVMLFICLEIIYSILAFYGIYIFCLLRRSVGMYDLGARQYAYLFK